VFELFCLSGQKVNMGCELESEMGRENNGEYIVLICALMN
jgi:hypothetical protein